LVWSRTFILCVGVGLADLGDLGRHLGGNKAVVGVFNVSSDRHCECLTKVREECGQIIKSKVPTDNVDTMREELEGVGIRMRGLRTAIG
jgi:hypothetical protein